MRPRLIEAELRRLYEGHADWSAGSRGLDLNGDGIVVRGTESFSDLQDLDRDGHIDDSEWLRYYQRNFQVLHANSLSLFALDRTHFTPPSAMDSFSPENPIHHLMGLYLLNHSAQEVEEVYMFVKEVQERVQRSLRPDLSPLEKMRVLFRVFDEMGIRLEAGSDFVDAVRNRRFDCDRSVYLALFATFELGWPLHYVLVPGHAFLRWGEGPQAQNFDYILYGNTRSLFAVPDSHYEQVNFVSPEAREHGIYLRNLTTAELLGTFYYNRHMMLRNSENLQVRQRAREDIETAYQYFPHPMVSILRWRERIALGYFAGHVNMLDSLIRDAEEIIQNDPQNSDALDLLALSYFNKARLISPRANDQSRGIYERALGYARRALEQQTASFWRAAVSLSYENDRDSHLLLVPTIFTSNVSYAHSWRGLLEAFDAYSEILHFMGRHAQAMELEENKRSVIWTMRRISEERVQFLQAHLFADSAGAVPESSPLLYGVLHALQEPSLTAHHHPVSFILGLPRLALWREWDLSPQNR